MPMMYYCLQFLYEQKTIGKSSSTIIWALQFLHLFWSQFMQWTIQKLGWYNIWCRKSWPNCPDQNKLNKLFKSGLIYSLLQPNEMCVHRVSQVWPFLVTTAYCYHRSTGTSHGWRNKNSVGRTSCGDPATVLFLSGLMLFINRSNAPIHIVLSSISQMNMEVLR